MSRIRDGRAVVAACALSVLVGACGFSSGRDKAGGRTPATPFVLTIASPNPKPHDLVEFSSAVDWLSGHGMRVREIDNVHGGDVDFDGELIGDVRSGRYPAAMVAARAWDLVGVRSFQPLVAPFVVSSYALEQRVLTGRLAARALAGIEPSGLVGVALLPGEMRYPIGVHHPILRASDVRNMRVGIRPSALSRETIRALGALPVGFIAGGDLAGLDAVVQDLYTVASEYGTVSKSATTNVPVWPRLLTIAMNRRAYDALTKAQREVLREAAAAAVSPALARIQVEQADAARFLCNAGYELLHAAPSEVVAFRAAVRPVVRRLMRDPAAAAAIRAIRRTPVQAADRRPPTCAAHGSPAPLPGAGSDALSGSWRANVTYAVQMAAKRIPTDDLEGNWGPYVMTFDRGQFTAKNLRFPEVPVPPCPYELHGSELVIHACSGGLAEGNGETWYFRWTLFHGRLQLTRLPRGDPGPTPFIATTWERLR